MGGPLALLKGLGLGAGLMYFCDPQMGRRRRAQFGDQFVGACHRMEKFLGVAATDLGNRAHGIVAEAGRLLVDQPAVDDHVLVARVRSRMGRQVAHPRAIVVDARGGCVTLRGSIFPSEVARLLAAVAAVPGVSQVEDKLDVSPSAELASGLPGRQGRASRPTAGGIGGTWSPGAKLVAGVAGGVLALRLFGRSSLPLLGLGLVGGALMNGRAIRPPGRGSAVRRTDKVRSQAGDPREARSQADPFHVDRQEVYAPETGP